MPAERDHLEQRGDRLGEQPEERGRGDGDRLAAVVAPDRPPAGDLAVDLRRLEDESPARGDGGFWRT
ncbi:hypothetical protein [Streptomyces virginiae]|uniref:hypothetical protein n=1 Tax=Streptomyces virginiae TaxID=1961 RepID=UPI00386CB6B5|nr:hypothetical protein OG253_35290 [Streptomyces virginiae]